jgi:hypothetical protein
MKPNSILKARPNGVLVGRALGLCAIITLSLGSYAQSSNSAIFEKSTLVSSANVVSDADRLALESIKLENTKMYRDFTKNFKNASEIQANSDEDRNTFILCKVDGITTRILYNKHGVCKRITRTYDETHLPSAVRSQVKNSFPGYSIFNVTEVTANGKLAYLVNMKGENLWKIVRVVDEEMDVYKEYVQN